MWLFLSILLYPLAPIHAQEVISTAFNPNILIPDSTFTDSQTFGNADGIQRFLESKGSILASTSPDFITKLNEPTSATVKLLLNDPEPNLDHPRTAAELIWDVSQSAGINPQIILVTLNKEQGLITGNQPADLQKALNHAMGFDCPDSRTCGSLFVGFYYQLFGNVDTAGNRYLGAAKSLMKSFSVAEGRGPAINGHDAQIGQTIAIENTIGGYVGILRQQLVTLANRATAALYRYTPHVYNGNYNFWKFFTAWFKYPNGTLLRGVDDSVVYILQDGSRLEIADFVAKARGIKLADAITASPSELQEYPVGQLYGPPDNTIASLNNVEYVFIGGLKHPASSFVLKQRKLNLSTAVALTSGEALLFPDGPQLTPNDGTVLQGESGTTVYLVQNGTLRQYSQLTLKQYNVAKSIEVIPDLEIQSYSKSGYVPPKDGTLVKSNIGSSVYLVNNGQRKPLTPELFKNLGYRLKDVVTLSNLAEIDAMSLGTTPTPKDGTYFAITGTSEFYLYLNGAKHPISPFVAQQRKAWMLLRCI